jgi:hypothetical protein
MTETRRWLVLAVVLMGNFMAILDVAIVNVGSWIEEAARRQKALPAG